MTPKKNRFSVFSQPLDRAALVAYFLGGIVPLIGLILVARHFAPEALLRPALAGLVLSMALLSLASFLLLQRTTRQAQHRTELDNFRLAELVRSSRSLADPADEDELLELAIRSAVALTGARAACFVSPLRSEVHLAIQAAHGPVADSLVQHHADEIQELAALALPETEDSAESAVVRGEIADRPASAVGIGAGCKLHGSLVLVRAQASHHDPGEDEALTALAGFVTVALRNADLRGKQRNFFTHVTNLLVDALDSHLDYQTDHSRRVARIANRIGRAMQLDERTLETLHFASLLHDIGMLRIAPASLEGGRLAIEKHPGIGFQMLKPIDLWSEVAPLVLHHHEHWDGGGYPDGLSGTDIPLECRIIAIAEAFDSMTSAQSYRVVVPIVEALGRINEAAGRQFDPEIAQIFLDTWEAEGAGLESTPSDTLT